jgi:hypothetical protein
MDSIWTVPLGLLLAWCGPLALFHVDHQPILSESLEDKMQVYLMLLCTGAADEDIVHLDECNIKNSKGLVIHEALERLARHGAIERSCNKISIVQKGDDLQPSCAGT